MLQLVQLVVRAPSHKIEFQAVPDALLNLAMPFWRSGQARLLDNNTKQAKK